MNNVNGKSLLVRDIPTTNEISSFCHCGMCLREMPVGVSPREYAQIEVGFTEYGIQVWCKRHEMNIIHLDFMGQKVRAK